MINNKKGFTLIELLAVITILSLLATISVVIVEGIMRKNNDKISSLEKENIKATAKTYVADNMDTISTELQTNGCYTVTGTTLNNEGYMELDEAKQSLELIVTKSGDKVFVEYPEEVSFNTSCYNLGESGIVLNGKYLVSNNNDGIIINANGELSGEFNNDNDKNIIIPNDVKKIGDEYGVSVAFHGKNLTSIILPVTLDYIGYETFRDNQLTSVILPNSITKLGGRAFLDNQLTSIVIPNSITELGASVFCGNQLISLTLPNSITTIPYESFSHNQLTSITIPNSVTTIGGKAFSVNELTNITIPDSVTTIGENAFSLNPLKTIINKTGREFNWVNILNSYYATCTNSNGEIDNNFETGSCDYSYIIFGREGTITGTVEITN